MKKIGYRIFAWIYWIFCILPRKKNKVFCIMTHDGSDGSNVGVVVSALKEKGGYQFAYLKKDERDKVTKQGKLLMLFDFFFVKPYHMATCSYILQDNVFLPMAYMKFPKEVNVVQLWHGTGTIKKFGQSVNEGWLGDLEKAADQTITHLIINGEATRPIYREAFGMEDDQVYELGLPRTDELFDLKKRVRLRQEFYQKYPMLKEKRLILYAPTFRDQEVHNPKLPFDLEELVKQLPEDTCFGFKLHPFVAKAFQESGLSENVKERVFNFSFEKDTNQLLYVADILITDYSSILFEYAVLRKPIVFYPYDYEDFAKHQRGFYTNYESFVPGPVAYTEQELIRLLQQEEFDLNPIDRFVKEQYRYTDGMAAKRLLDLVFGELR